LMRGCAGERAPLAAGSPVNGILPWCPIAVMLVLD
jgi:hypothetical protein